MAVDTKPPVILGYTYTSTLFIPCQLMYGYSISCCELIYHKFTAIFESTVLILQNICKTKWCIDLSKNSWIINYNFCSDKLIGNGIKSRTTAVQSSTLYNIWVHVVCSNWQWITHTRLTATLLLTDMVEMLWPLRQSHSFTGCWLSLLPETNRDFRGCQSQHLTSAPWPGWVRSI